MNKKIYRNYQSYIKTLDRVGTWLPGDLLQLGEVGTLRDGCFRRTKDLSDVGVSFTSEESSSADFVRTFGCKFSVSAGGEAKPSALGDAHLDFSFDQAGSFLLSAHRLRHSRIKDIDSVFNQVLDASRCGLWESDLILVDQIWTAERLVVVIAESSASQGSFFAKTSTALALEDLADSALDIAWVKGAGDCMHIDGLNMTPFFSGRRIKRGWFSRGRFEQIGTRVDDSEKDGFAPLDFMEDLMASWD